LTTLVHDHVLSPDPEEQEGIVELRDQIEHMAPGMVEAGRRRRQTAKLVGPDGTEVEIPGSAFSALQAVVRDMAQGHTITLIPYDRELTTKEAADILQVSRQFLVKLLDRGEIPFHRTGTHRRLRVEDVLAYRERRATERRGRLRELSRESQDVKGGYR
jgi:excisionase family DNA binding protein